MRTTRGNEFFHIIAANHRKGKVVCITCKLKGCVGRCRWEVVAPGSGGRGPGAGGRG